MLTAVWIEAIAAGKKVAIYCSDVSGAFDRVKMERLVAKLHAKKIHPQIIVVLESWLRQRTAHVIVGGKQSDEMTLRNMVFQGTVIGPDLWNLFFEDARLAINEWHYTEVAYADDLNAYRVFNGLSDNTDLLKSIARMSCTNGATQTRSPSILPKKADTYYLWRTRVEVPSSS